MTSELINVFLENTTLPLDVIKLILSLIEPTTFEFGKIYKEREDHVWKFKVIKKTQCYVTLGQFINPNLPHRSEVKRKIKHDVVGSEYVELWSKKAKLYS